MRSCSVRSVSTVYLTFSKITGLYPVAVVSGFVLLVAFYRFGCVPPAVPHCHLTRACTRYRHCRATCLRTDVASFVRSVTFCVAHVLPAGSFAAAAFRVYAHLPSFGSCCRSAFRGIAQFCRCVRISPRCHCCSHYGFCRVTARLHPAVCCPVGFYRTVPDGYYGYCFLHWMPSYTCCRTDLLDACPSRSSPARSVYYRISPYMPFLHVCLTVCRSGRISLQLHLTCVRSYCLLRSTLYLRAADLAGFYALRFRYPIALPVRHPWILPPAFTCSQLRILDAFAFLSHVCCRILPTAV